ncbi:MAG TPA: PD-(D/E)XK nuclease family protein, partial [Kiritimatiellia bacterium]|nr:PD-(D/E)XK nuclease family protein [Kiritimatiellia bacterium]
STTSEAAERGTRIHAAREGTDIPASADEAASLERGKALEREVVKAWQEANKLVNITEGPPESRFWLHDDMSLRALASAKVDVHYLGKDAAGNTHALVIDWKTGSKLFVPIPRNNMQLKLQSLLLHYEYDAKTVRACLNFTDEGVAEFHDFTVPQLKLVEAQIVETLSLASQPDAPRYAGRWCQYCPCVGDCPESASIALLPLSLTKLEVTAKNAAEIVDRLSADDWAYIYERKSIIEAVMEAVVERLRKLSDVELNRLGLKRAAAYKLYSVPEDKTKDAIETLVGQFGLAEDEAWQCLELKIGLAATAVAKLKGIKGDDAKEAIRNSLAAIGALTEQDVAGRLLKQRRRNS